MIEAHLGQERSGCLSKLLFRAYFYLLRQFAEVSAGLLQVFIGFFVFGLERPSAHEQPLIHALRQKQRQLVLRPAMPAGPEALLDGVRPLLIAQLSEILPGRFGFLLLFGKVLEELVELLFGGLVPARLRQEAIDSEALQRIRLAVFSLQLRMLAEQALHGVQAEL